MEKPLKGEYRAQEEYIKSSRDNFGPRNVPAHIMGQIRGAMVNEVMGLPGVRAAVHPGFSGRVQKWGTYDKPTRLAYAAEMGIDELKAAMILELEEDDREVLDFMLTRKDELQALEK